MLHMRMPPGGQTLKVLYLSPFTTSECFTQVGNLTQLAPYNTKDVVGGEEELCQPKEFATSERSTTFLASGVQSLADQHFIRKLTFAK